MQTPEFYRPTPYNKETKQQIWNTILTDSHDLHCGCTEPLAHIINDLIPPDHPARHLTIDSFINNCFTRQKCLFGGPAATDGGEEDIDHTTKENQDTSEKQKEGEFADIDAEDLLAIATAAEER